MKINPLQDRIVLKRIAESEMKGLIVIPEAAREKPQEAEVVSVGPGKKLENGDRCPMDVKPGDRVYIAKWAGTELNVDGEEILIVREDEILGIVERAAAAGTDDPGWRPLKKLDRGASPVSHLP